MYDQAALGYLDRVQPCSARSPPPLPPEDRTMPFGGPTARLRRGIRSMRPSLHRTWALALLAVLAQTACGAPVQADEPGTIETVAGTGEPGWLGGGYSGDAGDAGDARLNAPGALAFSADGTLFVADNDNNRIRSIDPESGTINTVAGGGSKDWAQTDSATAAALPPVTDVAVDSYGDTLYIASMLENQVAVVDLTAGSIGILAGRDDGGAADLPPRRMERLNALWWPTGIDVGLDGTLYIADSGNGRIVAVGPHEGQEAGRPEPDYVRVITGAGSTPAPGVSGGGGPDGYGSGAGGGGPADSGPLRELGRVAVGGDGSVYFVDGATGLSKVDAYENTATDGWDPRLPRRPEALAMDPRRGTLFAADAAGNRVVAFVPGRRAPVVVAGTGAQDFSGDGGPAAQAALDSPSGLAVSPGGDLYISDTNNHPVRVVHDVRAIADASPT